jgi:hypothetical protein
VPTVIFGAFDRPGSVSRETDRGPPAHPTKGIAGIARCPDPGSTWNQPARRGSLAASYGSIVLHSSRDRRFHVETPPQRRRRKPKNGKEPLRSPKEDGWKAESGVPSPDAASWRNVRALSSAAPDFT